MLPAYPVQLVACFLLHCIRSPRLLVPSLTCSCYRLCLHAAGVSRGYAFVEFEHKKDMKEAYKMSDGRKVEGRRIKVDVERGRTVDGWRPRRLGGGLGGEGRLPKEPKNKPLDFSRWVCYLGSGSRVVLSAVRGWNRLKICDAFSQPAA